MEHRWGRRVNVQVPVQLISDGAMPTLGHLENVSVSGAFVRTDWRGPLGARIELEVLPKASREQRPYRVIAHVIRSTHEGTALEWCELAPQPVRMLLAKAHAPLRCATRSEPHGRARPPIAPPAVPGSESRSAGGARRVSG